MRRKFSLKTNSLNKSVVIVMIAMFLFSAGSVSTYFVQASSPAGIVFSVPVTLTNSQSVATPSPFQQRIVVDSTSYAPYEAQNLKNIEFFDSSGSVIPSWLESGNSNGATNTVYWLSLPSGIPAGSNVTVYMGFASLSTNLLNAQTTGEAPQLSSVYGEYDDGANIFALYDSFAGTSLSNKWNVNLGSGTYQVNNGLTINYDSNSAPGYVLSSATFGPGTAFDASVTSIEDVCNVGYFNLQDPLPTQPGGPGYAGAFIRLAGGKTYPDQWNSRSGESNPSGTVFGYLANAEFILGVYTVEVLSPTSSMQYLDNSIGSSTQPLNTNYPDYPASVGFDSANNRISVQWARVRALPPNDVMPTVAMPTVGQIYPVVFTESVLARGTQWYVTLNNQTQSSTTNSITFNVFNGTYYFSISPPAGYTMPTAQESGTITVNEAGVTQTVAFTVGTNFIYTPETFPTSIYYQPYIYATYAGRTFIENVSEGPTAVSIGAMNGPVAVEVSQNGQTLLSTDITGESSNYVVISWSNSYTYVNFVSDGLPVTLSFSAISGNPLIAFNLYNNYITNSTASLIIYPAQFAANLGPPSTPVNTGISFLLVAPTYAQPTPLAIWVGEGYSNSQTGQEWYAQLGFTADWGNNVNVSYAFVEIFSNIFGNSPINIDYNYPLVSGDTYNFTMALVSGTTWEFVANATSIQLGTFTGFYNLTSSFSNEGADLGLETLTYLGGNVGITNMISLPMVMSFQVNGQWSEPSSFSFGTIGENWHNGEATSAPGIDLWGIAGNLQDSSIPNGALLFNDSLPMILDAPNLSYEPIYGDFAAGQGSSSGGTVTPTPTPPAAPTPTATATPILITAPTPTPNSTPLPSQSPATFPNQTQSGLPQDAIFAVAAAIAIVAIAAIALVLRKSKKGKS